MVGDDYVVRWTACAGCPGLTRNYFPRLNMKNHQRINGDGGSDEYYTPEPITDAARRTMGTIDLDPFSSETANKMVRAKSFFGIGDDAMSQHWFGRVWMNHPFGRKTNRPCVSKLVEEWKSGRVEEAICITFASTSEQWFKPLLSHPQCFLHGRTNYYLPDGTLKKGVTKGSVVTYLGNNVERFAAEFKHLGTVKISL